MKIFFTMVLSCVVGRCFAQWAVVDTVNTKYSNVYFYNDSIGFLSAYEFYKKTTDGGSTWATDLITPGENAGKFYFLNPDTGFRTGYSTHDGGETWSVANIDNAYCFTSGNKYGYTAITSLLFSFPTYKSDDYGENWQAVASAPLNDTATLSYPRTVYFSDSLHGIIGDFGGYVHYTNNGAISWNTVDPLGYPFDYTAVYMISNTNAYIAAHRGYVDPFGNDPGLILHSTNGGQTWEEVDSVYGQVNKIAFIDSLNGYLCTYYNLLYSTHDGGRHWGVDTNIINVVDFSITSSPNIYVLTWDSVFATGNVYKRDFINDIQLIKNTKDVELCVYPNPSSNDIIIEADASENAYAIVFNIMGESLFKVKLTGAKTTIPIDKLVKGLYFVKISNLQAKFIKD
ncbi:MAG TPA: T9SS type A sorting domain-containing protein [Chitinophagales bacterium]|nr:T9SS type A sorting domain-containing protein [Chitinophagales bacterium]